MTKNISNVVVATDTFQAWLNITNEMATAMRDEVVTVDGTVNGNVTVNGSIFSTSINVTTANVHTVNVTGNVHYSNTSFQHFVTSDGEHVISTRKDGDIYKYVVSVAGSGGDELILEADGADHTNANTVLRVGNNIVMHSGNDGDGSGFDADTVDGNEASDLLDRANHTGTQLLTTISDVGNVASKNTGDVNGRVPLVGVGDKLNTAILQTDAQIKTQYENNSDTNAFTDALKSKLEGLDETTVGVVAESADLDDIIDSGFYRLSNTQTNAPSGTSWNYAQMLVIHGGADTITQIIYPYNDATFYWIRSGNPSEVGGAGSYSSWVKYNQLSDTDVNTLASALQTGDAIETEHLATRSSSDADALAGSVGTDFKYLLSGATGAPDGTDHALLTMAYSSDWAAQMAADWRTNDWHFRVKNNGTWEDWKKMGGLPVGTSIMYNGTSAPDGFLKENGAAVSRTTFADLFAVIGTTYGSGDGSTTFNLPDSRGEFFRGLDDGRGVDSGRSLGQHQADQNKSHTHSGSTGAAGAHGHSASTGGAGSHGHSASTGSGGNHRHVVSHNVTGSDLQSAGQYLGQSNPRYTEYAGSHTHSVSVSSVGNHTHTVSVGAVGDHTHSLTINSEGGSEARPRNQAKLMCIKY